MLSVSKRSLKGWLVLLGDLAALFLGFLAVYWLRFSGLIFPIPKGVPPFQNYAQTLLIIIPVYLWVFRSYGLYQIGRHRRRVEEIFMVLKGVTVGTLLLMALSFFYRGFSYSRLFLVFLWIFACFFVSFFRYLLIEWFYWQRLREKDLHRILIVGSNRNARNLIQWSQQNPHFGHQVEGILVQDRNLVGKHLEGVSIIGALDDWDALVQKVHPDEVVVADSKLSKEKVADLILRCEDKMISFKVAADLYGIVTSNLDIEYIASVPLLGLRPLPLDDFLNRFIKRTFDVVLAAALLILLSPIFAFSILALLLNDRGSVFYKQERVGQDGRYFMLYKFRTMRRDAESKTGPVWAGKSDDRCTPVGKVLRRLNLDELPQLWNVLKGEMSLVGPRPERPHFVDQFRSQIPRYMARHKIKSGITGWAQVNGLRGNTSLQERIKYDLYYAENWSLLLDLEILFMTFFAFKNAY